MGAGKILGSALFAMTACSLLCWPARTAAETLSALQLRFDRETNSVRKAKLLEKLGEAQFEETRRAEKADDFNTAGLVWEKYRDNVRVALEALKKDHPDAENKSNGYRQLEISLRRGIREVDETLVSAPEPYKPPLQLVRQDLISMDDELLHRLFPPRMQRQTAPQPPPGEKT